jgi:hypothetical protein
VTEYNSRAGIPLAPYYDILLNESFRRYISGGEVRKWDAEWTPTILKRRSKNQGHESSLGQPRALVFPETIEIPGSNRTSQIINKYLGWLMALRRLSCSSVSHFAIYPSTSILKQARLSPLVIRSTAQEDYQMKIKVDCLRVGT